MPIERNVIVVDADRPPPLLDLPELWRYRELFLTLVWRDVKVRYKQTVFGVLWAVGQPLLSAAVFTAFFGRLAGIPSDDRPYPAFVLCGLVPWTFFAAALSGAAQSVVGEARLLTKVYFPRLIIPLVPVGASLVDLGASLLVLLAVLLAYGIVPTPRALLLVGPILLAVLAALGVGSLLSALNVKFRDFRYVVPFLLQSWLFVTPVIYPLSMVPPQHRWLVSLNPMTGAVEGFRGALLGPPVDPAQLALSAAVAAASVIVGGLVFRRVDRDLADIV